MSQLEQHATKFRKWQSENYPQGLIDQLATDDTAYPDWNVIEDHFYTLIDNDGISALSREDQVHLLYLIARNWNIGRMMSWLHPHTPLAGFGELKTEDFIMLAQTLTQLEHPEFDDAKSQFAVSFRKLDTLTPEVEKILLDLYNDKSDYVKRLALITLGAFNHPELEKLVRDAWSTFKDEHGKIGCLHVLDQYANDPILLKHYISMVSQEDGEHLLKYAHELRRKNGWIGNW